MKKLLLSALAVCAFTFANAQEEKTEAPYLSKGDIMISGSFGLGSDKYSSKGNFQENDFNFNPRASYFVSDNIAVGITAGYASGKIEVNEGDDTADTNTVTVGAMGRYLFTPTSKFSLFAELGAEYATKSMPSDDKVNGFGLGLSPGICYFISNNFAIEASWGLLGYGSAKGDWDGAEASTSVDFGLDTNDLSLGLAYKF
ncbi:MAG: hypothetical protein COA88_07580 [Kordia sp.]|nr:MAG: hypothetical protein COA88_07580 [Kordia sp.]